jgi:hypothetical protein
MEKTKTLAFAGIIPAFAILLASGITPQVLAQSTQHNISGTLAGSLICGTATDYTAQLQTQATVSSSGGPATGTIALTTHNGNTIQGMVQNGAFGFAGSHWRISGHITSSTTPICLSGSAVQFFIDGSCGTSVKVTMQNSQPRGERGTFTGPMSCT